MFFILFFLMVNQNTLCTLEVRLTHIPEDESNEVEQKPCAVQDHCLKQLLHITAPILKNICIHTVLLTYKPYQTLKIYLNLKKQINSHIEDKSIHIYKIYTKGVSIEFNLNHVCLIHRNLIEQPMSYM